MSVMGDCTYWIIATGKTFLFAEWVHLFVHYGSCIQHLSLVSLMTTLCSLGLPSAIVQICTVEGRAWYASLHCMLQFFKSICSQFLLGVLSASPVIIITLLL